MKRAWAGLCLLLVAGTPLAAAAEDLDKPLDPNRRELVVVPDVGGDSDIGVEIGLSVTLVKFKEGGYRPYRYRMDAVAGTSFKADPGFRTVQQYHSIRFDVPRFLSDRLRLQIQANYLRLVDAAWFGSGNATVREDLPPPPGVPTVHNYVSQHARVRGLARISTGTPLDLAIGWNLRYEFPDVHTGTKLAADVATGTVLGGESAFLETVAAGFIYDTRDNEFVPRHGVFYQVGVAETVGTKESIVFGEASAVLSHYASLAPPLVFASRMIASAKFGEVPFYELQQGGVFEPLYLLGSYRGIRGLRIGRYAGKLKMIANTELRLTPFPAFHAFGSRFLVGNTAFFDAGRVFADYSTDLRNDGNRVGIKYSAGGGFFFQVDTATIFRVEVAYSPDSASEGIPLSFYFENGFAF